MRSKTQTTYILLERGTEDRDLWIELNKIIAESKIKSIKTFIIKYPLLNKLKDTLKQEIDSQNEI